MSSTRQAEEGWDDDSPFSTTSLALLMEHVDPPPATMTMRNWAGGAPLDPGMRKTRELSLRDT
jgi:hypothetical protein